MLDTTITLTDGRSLAYTDLGSESGPLVFYFHGAPSSRLDLVGADDELAALGVRVVCPDRPGYGKSSPQPGRDRNGWAADVAALADHLDRERFAVAGISSGGPYAVTCAALLPERVAAACVVAGVTDMTWPPSLDGYDELWITIMRLDDEVKAKTWCDEHLGPDGSAMMAEMPALAPADQAWLEQPGTAEQMSATMAEAFRQGTVGFAQDLTIENRPWTFDTRAILASVRVVHGDADTLVPLAHSRHTAGLIAGATLDILPGHGHISTFTELPRWCSDVAQYVR